VNEITGQLIFRDAAKSCEHLIPNDKRKLVMVFGIIAVPEEYDIKGEHQYEVCGKELDESMLVQIIVLRPTAQDMSEYTIGNTPGGIFKSPIWRI
jgi:hypothetical protein